MFDIWLVIDTTLFTLYIAQTYYIYTFLYCIYDMPLYSCFFMDDDDVCNNLRNCGIANGPAIK